MTLIRNPERVAWTPTGSWVANTTYSGFYRHDPQAKTLDLDVGIELSSDPGPNGSLDVNLPPGFLIDFARLPSDATTRNNLGNAILLDSGTAWRYAFVCVGHNTQTLQVCYLDTLGSTQGVTDAQPFVFDTFDAISFAVRGLPVQ